VICDEQTNIIEEIKKKRDTEGTEEENECVMTL